MIKLKDIAELPIAESAESVSFVVHEDGVAKQVPYDYLLGDNHIVNVTASNSADGYVYTADKTFAEIYEMLTEGELVAIKYGSMYYYPHIIMNNVVQFAFITTESGQSAKNVLTFRADGSIKYDSVVFNQQAIATKNSNSTLKTADKTLVGAINELADSVESVSWNDLKDKPFYVEMKEVTVEVAPEVMGYSDILLDGFPPFNVGDTVTVKVDGVEHSLVAFFDDGCATIGDTYAEFENGNGSFGWYIYCVENEVVFDSLNYHTLTYQGEIVHKIDPKYISNFATPVIDPTNYNAFMFSYHLNTDESFTEFDAVRADEFEILRNVIKWGLENRAVFYNFNYGFTYSIMINPPHEFTGGYESIQIQANFCNLPGFYNNAMDYTWYMDSDFRIWGKCYYFQENLFNETN